MQCMYGSFFVVQLCSVVGSYSDSEGKKVMISSMVSVVNQNGQMVCMFWFMLILLMVVLMNSIEFIGGVIRFRLLVSISIRLKWIGLMLQVWVIGRKIGVQIRIIGVRFMKVFSNSSIIMIISSIMNWLCVNDCRNLMVVVGICRQVSSQLNMVVVVIMNRIMFVLCVVWMMVLKNLCQCSCWYSMVVISKVQIIVMVVFFIVVKMLVWMLMKISVIRFKLGRVEMMCRVMVCQLGKIFMLQSWWCVIVQLVIISVSVISSVGIMLVVNRLVMDRFLLVVVENRIRLCDGGISSVISVVVMLMFIVKLWLQLCLIICGIIVLFIVEILVMVELDMLLKNSEDRIEIWLRLLCKWLISDEVRVIRCFEMLLCIMILFVKMNNGMVISEVELVLVEICCISMMLGIFRQSRVVSVVVVSV